LLRRWSAKKTRHVNEKTEHDGKIRSDDQWTNGALRMKGMDAVVLVIQWCDNLPMSKSRVRSRFSLLTPTTWPKLFKSSAALSPCDAGGLLTGGSNVDWCGYSSSLKSLRGLLKCHGLSGEKDGDGFIFVSSAGGDKRRPQESALHGRT
jgi:hypothetical protein